MSVEFEDYSVRVKEAIDEAANAWLYEAGGEMETQTKNRMPQGTWFGYIKRAWAYRVDESKKEVVVGNPLEPSLWVEFGTGEHALHGDGRKGYWIYVKDGSTPGQSYTYKGGKSYTLAEAKEIVAMMRADGLDAHYTNGQKPHRPFQQAFNSLKNPLKKRAQEIFRERLGK